MSWALIITLTVGGITYDDGSAAVVTQVPGFQTEDLCMRAGNAWLSKTVRIPQELRGVTRSALCVQVSP
ncbi:hypothetical protein [Xanthomonas phage DMF5-T1]|nr:hypothetical protein [Xanthomonas phage DMF5-T1]